MIAPLLRPVWRCAKLGLIIVVKRLSDVVIDQIITLILLALLALASGVAWVDDLAAILNAVLRH